MNGVCFQETNNNAQIKNRTKPKVKTAVDCSLNVASVTRTFFAKKLYR